MNAFDACETAYRNGKNAAIEDLIRSVAAKRIKANMPAVKNIDSKPLTELLMEVGIANEQLAKAVATNILDKYAPLITTTNDSEMHPSDEFICGQCGFTARDCSGYDAEEDVEYEFPYRFCPKCGKQVVEEQ